MRETYWAAAAAEQRAAAEVPPVQRRKDIQCCDCGTTLVCVDVDAETKLALCSACWRAIEAAVIVWRARQHAEHGHTALCKRIAKAGKGLS